MLLGTLFVLFGEPPADPIASIVVATIIAYNGIRLFIEISAFMIGRSPGKAFLGELETRTCPSAGGSRRPSHLPYIFYGRGE